MADRQTDEALAGAVASGDERAFGLLVSRHLERVRAVANGYVGNRADADDIAQEVFIAVWRKAARFRPDRGGRFTTWLYRVTVNRCIDHRRRQRDATVPIDDVQDRLAGPENPETAAADRSELTAVAGAVAALPDRQRMALLLSVSAGLANADIAKTMGISNGAVEQLLVRARGRLRAELMARENGIDDQGHL